MKFAWINKLMAVWPVTLMCQMLGVSISGFSEHRQRSGKTPPAMPASSRVSNEALVAENLLARDFTPEAPDRVWSSDITSIATDEGWLYLAAVVDLFSRQVVGWSMRPHMQTSLVTDALRMAWFRGQPEPGLIFHSDRGKATPELPRSVPFG